jgi:hypothetical protein
MLSYSKKKSKNNNNKKILCQSIEEARQKVQEDHMNYRKLDKEWTKDEGLAIMAIKEDPKLIADIPDSLKNDTEFFKLIIKLVKDDPKKYWKLPYDYKVKDELAIESIKGDAQSLHYVPRDKKVKKDFLLEVVKANASVIQYIDKNFLNNEIYSAALKSDGDALGFLSQESKTKELCLVALKNNPNALKSVPEKLRSDKDIESICLEAINTKPGIIEYFSDKLKLYNIKECHNLVKNNNGLIKFMSLNIMVNGSITNWIVECNDESLKWTNKENNDVIITWNSKDSSFTRSQAGENEIIEFTINSKEFIEIVSYEQKALDELQEYRDQNGNIKDWFQGIHESLKKNPKFHAKAIEICAGVITVLPQDQKTLELCLAAVKKSGKILYAIPQEIINKDPNILTEAVKNYVCALQFVDDKNKTKELCSEAVKQDSNAIKFVPEKVKMNNLNLCYEAVKTNVSLLKFISLKVDGKEYTAQRVKESFLKWTNKENNDVITWNSENSSLTRSQGGVDTRITFLFNDSKLIIENADSNSEDDEMKDIDLCIKSININTNNVIIGDHCDDVVVDVS